MVVLMSVTAIGHVDGFHIKHTYCISRVDYMQHESFIYAYLYNTIRFV